MRSVYWDRRARRGARRGGEMFKRRRVTFPAPGRALAVVTFVITGLGALGSARGAEINWQTSPGLADTEVSTRGVQLFGYYFSPSAAPPPIAMVNGVPFVQQTTATAPP